MQLMKSNIFHLLLRNKLSRIEFWDHLDNIWLLDFLEIWKWENFTNRNKKNLLDNPGKYWWAILDQTSKLRPGNCQSCQPFPSCLLILHHLQVSAKDIRMNDRNTLSFWVLKCLIQTPKRNSLLLSLRLSLKSKNHPSLSVWFVFFS